MYVGREEIWDWLRESLAVGCGKSEAVSGWEAHLALGSGPIVPLLEMQIKLYFGLCFKW
jgi:hypothetical protein